MAGPVVEPETQLEERSSPGVKPPCSPGGRGGIKRVGQEEEHDESDQGNRSSIAASRSTRDGQDVMELMVLMKGDGGVMELRERRGWKERMQ